MRTTISLGQWQPWTAVSPLLGLINIAQPSSQWTGDPVSQREISNKASNVASRSEIGRLSLIINIYKNIPYYILYLLRKNEDIVKQAFRASLELHYNHGKNSFYHNLIKISEYFSLPDFDPNNLSEAMIKYCITKIKQEILHFGNIQSF